MAKGKPGGGGGKPPDDPPPPADPAILFVNNGIKVMNADGSNQTTLLSIPDSGSSCPNWSPCGDQIVFEADINGQGIFLMNSDGGGLRKLVSTSFGVNDPVWSPVPIDGKEWIAYMDEVEPDSGEFSLFLADVDCQDPG